MLADIVQHHVEGRVLCCGFTLQRIHSDYGYDYVMWTYNARGEIESGFVYFQIKATDRLPLLAGNMKSINNCPERCITVSKACIRFAKLRQLLLGLEFTEIVVPDSHIGFRHELSDTTIMLPIY